MTVAYIFCEKFGEYWTDECGKKRWSWKERSPDSYTEENVAEHGGILVTIMQYQKDAEHKYQVPTDYSMMVFHDGSWIIDDGRAQPDKPNIGWASYWSGPFGEFLRLAQKIYVRRKNLGMEILV